MAVRSSTAELHLMLCMHYAHDSRTIDGRLPFSLALLLIDSLTPFESFASSVRTLSLAKPAQNG